MKKARKEMLEEKWAELLRYQITETFLVYRIEEHEETERRQSLINVRSAIQELEKQVEFLKK